MARYRKLPVEIEAVQFLRLVPVDGEKPLPLLDQTHPWPSWLCEAIQKPPAEHGALFVRGGPRPSLRVMTLEGSIEASPGDYIIRGVSGEIYPCKPHIFAKTYEAAE